MANDSKKLPSQIGKRNKRLSNIADWSGAVFTGSSFGTRVLNQESRKSGGTDKLKNVAKNLESYRQQNMGSFEVTPTNQQAKKTIMNK